MRYLGLFVLILAAAVITSASGPIKVGDTCCFTHPNYSGTCEVRPGEDETCQTVLEYLNTPNSQGKTYCEGSNLRGGWLLVSCEEMSEKSALLEPTAGCGIR